MGRKTFIAFLFTIYFCFSGGFTGQVRADFASRPDETFFRPKIPSLSSFKIMQTHPRIFLTPNQTKKIDTNDIDYKTVKLYVDKMKETYVSSPSTINGYLSTDTVFYLIPNACLVAITEPVPNNQTYINTAKAWVTYAMNNVSLGTGDDICQRDRLYSLAIAYDWLYPYFTAQERTDLSNKIVEYLVYLDNNYHWYSKPNYTIGHTKRGNIGGLAAVLAIYGENPQVNVYLDKIFRNWLGNPKGLQYVITTTSRDGGHYFGWRYGPVYASPSMNWMWYTATGNMVEANVFNYMPYFYIYGTDPYVITNPDGTKLGTLPSIGDCWSVWPDGVYDSDSISFSSAFYKNGFAEWYYKKYFTNYLYYGARWTRVIAKTMGVPAVTSPSQLPLARNFTGCGIVAARNTWQDIDKDTPSVYPTILVFKSTPYYTSGHDHLDRNSFVLNYKGPLLLDSGVYDDWGTNHWKTYYSQTIAHNSLLIDGFGQSPDTQGSIIPTSTDGVQCVSDTRSTDGIWMQGEATNAYAASFGANKPVKKYLRDILMAYKPIGLNNSVLLVLDRIDMSENHTPKLLWQVKEVPSLNANYAQIKNNYGGFARLEFFANANIQLSAAANSGFPNNSSGNGFAGWGRVELSTQNPVSNVTFATLITVNDTSTSLPLAKYVTKDNWVGVNINNSLLIIADSSKQLSNISIDPNGMILHEIYVAGLKNGPCGISVGTQTFNFTVTDGFYHIQF